jgi:hypothetical protein
LEESEPGMDEKWDGMGDDMSLASGGETVAFSSFTMSQETTVPPLPSDNIKQWYGNIFG